MVVSPCLAYKNVVLETGSGSTVVPHTDNLSPKGKSDVESGNERFCVDFKLLGG